MDQERLTIVDRISLAISRVAMYLTAFIVAIIAYEVVLRYLFKKPTLWVNEMSLWAGGMVYLLAGLYAMQRRGHIQITALYDHVPRALQRVFDTISLVCILAFAGGVIIGGWTSATNALLRWERYGTAWDPPIPATLKPMILIVTALVAIQAISNYIVDIRKKERVTHSMTPDTE